MIEKNTALIIVDVQNDFCEGGALAVEGGKKVAHGIAQLVHTMGNQFQAIALTQDWHRPWPNTNQGHFSQTPDFVDSWPVHCVSSSEGAEFHPAVRTLTAYYPAFRKGLGASDYSGFQGTRRLPTREQSLHDYLQVSGIRNLYVVGIAGDYCVRQTALDGVELGYDVTIPTSLVASVRGPAATYETVAEVARAMAEKHKTKV